MTFIEFRVEIEKLLGVKAEDYPALEALEDVYRRWNAAINVISRKDIDNLYSHHVLHSLVISAYLRQAGISLEGASVMDLGCGGGFPSIPLAILHPEAHFTLVDSVGKKIKVASSVASELGLSNVSTVVGRAESLGQDFDWIVSRAVTALDPFLDWIVGRYRRGIIYLKGGDIASEIALCSSRHRIPQGKFHVFPVDAWLSDDYFAGKVLLHIEK